MALFVASLNSGSNGNCYYIGNDYEAVLIDAGISCRETEKRMDRLNLSISNVRAIFISHEHVDHIKGVETISRKYQLPVYITEKTLYASGIELQQNLVYTFKKNEPVKIGGLEITAFPKFHDAEDPHSFTVNDDMVKVGVFTDIGKACKDVIKHFKLCHAVFLESNYDGQMLTNGNYPIHLQQRISNGNGHLSNIQALELFRAHRPAFMTHLFLSHLSHNNNSPEIVNALFSKYTAKTTITIASRERESAVYLVHTSKEVLSPHDKKNKEKLIQLSLF